MGGYIGAKTGTLVASASDIRGDISATDTTPEITLKNTTETDADGSRSSKITFQGEQSGGEQSILAQIQASHDGTADDEKGDLIFKTNDGNDATSPTERLRIDSNGSILTSTLGTDNVHLGEGAGASIASGGTSNVAIGKNALTANTTGTQNTALGTGSLGANTTASYNTAVGYNAGVANTTGTKNAFFGSYTGDANTTGSNNTAIGQAALSANTTGDSHTAVGNDALISNTTGAANTAVGYQAMYTNTTGYNSVAIGRRALYLNTTGLNNVAVGWNALQANTTGGSNVAVGLQSLTSNTTASNNTSVGYQAMYSNTTGAENTCIGGEAGYALTFGGRNTFLGYGAGYHVAGGYDNTVVGKFNGNQDSTDIRNTNDQIAISNGDGKVRMFSNSDGYSKFKDDSVSGFFGSGGSYHEFNQSNNDTSCLIISTRHGSYNSTALYNQAQRSATSSYDFYRSLSGGGGDVEHRLVGDGNAYADGSWNGGGADYAEYFEWADANSTNQDRTGYTVVLDNEKIRLATSDDAAANIIGAVSVNPSVIGDSDIERWKQKYLKNDFGAYQKETYTITEWTETVVDQEAVDEVLDDDGKVVTPALRLITREVFHNYETDKIPDDLTVPDNATVSTKDANGNTFERRVLNPDYNPDAAYVSREDRQEWATIGMMGKLRIRKGQPTGDRWIKMRDISDTVEEWLVR